MATSKQIEFAEKIKRTVFEALAQLRNAATQQGQERIDKVEAYLQARANPVWWINNLKVVLPDWRDTVDYLRIGKDVVVIIERKMLIEEALRNQDIASIIEKRDPGLVLDTITAIEGKAVSLNDNVKRAMRKQLGEALLEMTQK